MDLNSLFERILGGSYDQMKSEGAKNYPDVAPGSQHHAEAARRLSEQVGFIPTQLAGLGVEGLEAWNGNRDWADTGRDLGANLLGGAEGAVNQLIPGLNAGTAIRNQLVPPSSQTQTGTGDQLREYLIRKLGQDRLR